MIKCTNCGAQLEIRVVSTVDAPKGTRVIQDQDSVGSLLQAIDDGSLNDYEKEFIDSTRERYEKYHDKIMMSDKQMAILRKIAGKTF